MNDANPQTPFQDGVSMIGIASVIVGLECYVAVINEVPLVPAFLFSVAVQVYHWLPVLNALHATSGANAGRRTDDRNSLLHLHYPAGLLVGGRVHSGWHQKHGTADSAACELSEKYESAMTTISRLHEGKSLEGKIGEHWAKNGDKLPIVRHCRLDLTRSVRTAVWTFGEGNGGKF